MSYSNCGGRDFTKEWQTINSNVELTVNLNSDSKKNNKIIILVEAYPAKPMAYDVDILKQYKAVITWNSKFYDANKDKLNIHLISPFTYTYDVYDPHTRLDAFIDYGDKIDGICLVSNLLTFYDANEGGIGFKRLEAMKNLSGLVKHIYGGTDCGEMYQGSIGKASPEFTVADSYRHRIDKLCTVNKYKFTLIFENCYHPFWSWDYVTEKIFDAFKSKTVAIYYGCYNIEEHIPRELYVDFREFDNRYDELSKYLREFPEKKYIKMTEDAYRFHKEKEPAFLEDLKGILRDLK